MVEDEDGIYISDQKSLDIPSFLLKRTQSSASEVLCDHSKDLKRLYQYSLSKFLSSALNTSSHDVLPAMFMSKRNPT